MSVFKMMASSGRDEAAPRADVTVDCPASRRRAHGGFVVRLFARLAVVVALAPVIALAQSITSNMTFDELREYQVERFLAPRIEQTSSDGAWVWGIMINECTRILMNGSPEQDRESARVRLTHDAQLFLMGCAEKKGFRLKE